MNGISYLSRTHAERKVTIHAVIRLYDSERTVTFWCTDMRDAINLNSYYLVAIDQLFNSSSSRLPLAFR